MKEHTHEEERKEESCRWKRVTPWCVEEPAFHFLTFLPKNLQDEVFPMKIVWKEAQLIEFRVWIHVYETSTHRWEVWWPVVHTFFKVWDEGKGHRLMYNVRDTCPFVLLFNYELGKREASKTVCGEGNIRVCPRWMCRYLPAKRLVADL